MPAPAVFAALASPVRRRILELLLDGPRAASAIASEFPLNRPAVSEHVQVLRSMGLVREEARGRQRFYHLDPAPLAEITAWLRPFERYWARRIRALKETLDKEDQK
jgi:DNA-binding transcriptional ArsR family regulator